MGIITILISMLIVLIALNLKVLIKPLGILVVDLKQQKLLLKVIFRIHQKKQ